MTSFLSEYWYAIEKRTTIYSIALSGGKCSLLSFTRVADFNREMKTLIEVDCLIPTFEPNKMCASVNKENLKKFVFLAKESFGNLLGGTKSGRVELKNFLFKKSEKSENSENSE